ncbi:DUF3017 domain-containing protein [Bifidobacterium xylocopae]|uniref:DUF3017 domain-containing protein n=1 Tax=Bifidobacterium xylocopae TaxID=2493119 RepID=A0A366KC28_9BIFI|nr:DUF3017 domain-containing protein [Bifidobacterium xylocopae]RBP99280.1 DUF3017 domain-containing protein [Bifidobacterium xylocopae]
MNLVARHKHEPGRSSAESVRRPPTGRTDQAPRVSEAGEGKPQAEWAVGLLVICSALLAATGHTLAGTCLMALTSLVLGLLRLFLRERSPWKVRSVGFDVFICIGLGLGLMITYLSVLLLF